MKQTIQQTAVQRALQPAARSIPTGLEQFDMADTEGALQEQVDDRVASYQKYKERSGKRKAKLQTVVEDELAAPSQTDYMMASSSAAASSSASASAFAAADSYSGYINDTDIAPIRPRTQSYGEQTSRNLRGSAEVPRWGGLRRTQSSASVALEVAPAPLQQSTDIDVLLEAARYRRSELTTRGTVADHQLVMEIKTLALGIEKLRSGGSESKTRDATKLYTTLKKRLIQILETPL